ncbi:3'-5' exonuclease [Methylobacterium sp. CCH5-D2]|uniref:3'-5' exonuclease n=1 Tax=Methylobacterium sp. CCH5-D2 TaxID=1768765 RepID=UPI0008324496|nr:3'-5' exonuclease [Methylobacterium sp. CCH5-D2]
MTSTFLTTHVMLDLETLGTAPGSVILTIGAVAFDPLAGEVTSSFSRAIRPASAVAYGLRIDPDTVAWWTRQGAAAREAAFPEQADELPIALQTFRFWLEQWAPHHRRIWGHGATFDPVLLAEAYRACKLDTPWGHRDARDTRTLFDLAGIGKLDAYRREGDVEHDALADARVQVRAVLDAYHRLNLGVAA